MMKIKKAYNSKIIAITTSTIILLTAPIYSSQDNLRLPIGTEDDTLEAMGEVMRYFAGKREFSKEEQTLNFILEEAVSKNRIEEFYENDNSYNMTISIWPGLLEESYKRLAKISRILGDWCVIHNTRHENVDGILKRGISPGIIGTGFMIYDFKNRYSIIFGLSHAVWQVMRGKLSIEGLMGNVELNNIVAIIGDKSDRSIMMNARDIQDDLDAQGFSWYGITWGGNATAHFAIDLSIDTEKLNAIINDFVGRHEEIPKEHKKAVIERLKQIAIVYIWMERLSDGIELFASQPKLKDRLDSLRKNQDVIQTGN